VAKVNWKKGTEMTRERIRGHWRALSALWRSFEQIVLPHVDGKGVCIECEWPAACAYRQWSADSRDMDGSVVPPVKETLGAKLPLTALVHGCEHVLCTVKGGESRFVRKMWRIDSDCSAVICALQRESSMNLNERRTQWGRYRCIHDRTVRHAHCAGRVTKSTEHYPAPCARVVHKAWRVHTETRQQGTVVCACAVPVRIGNGRYGSVAISSHSSDDLLFVSLRV